MIHLIRLVSIENQASMHVVKHDGSVEPVSFDKITKRLDKLAQKHLLTNSPIDCSSIAQAIARDIKNYLKTSDIDEYAVETAAYYAARHPDYEKLASAVLVSNMHKQSISFSPVDHLMENVSDGKSGVDSHVAEVADEFRFYRIGLAANENHCWMPACVQE